jgi:nucleotide-binding universal stress UspA family protein
MWKNILVPHDFSPCADRALRLAVELARVHRAEISLLHVSDLPDDLTADTIVEPPGEGSVLVVADYATRGALRRLEQIAEPLRREGLAVLTKAVTGICADEILVATRELGTDLLVVGTHGRTGLSHFWLGSVAEELVRRASIPVLSVRVPSVEAEPTIEERDAEDELAG